MTDEIYTTLSKAIDAIDYKAISMCLRILDWDRLEERNNEIGFFISTSKELKNSVVKLASQLKEDELPQFDENGEAKIAISSGGFKVLRKKYSDSETELWKISFTIDVSAMIEDKDND